MYVALLLSLSFATISTIASVFNFVIQQNGFSLPESLSGLGHVLLALAALTNLFDAWSTPLLFLSICLLIRDRHLALQKARAMNFFPFGFYALFALSLIFGTTSASLYLDYLSILYFGRFRNHTIAWLNHKIVLYLDLTYTFSSLWYFSAGVTLLYAAFVYRDSGDALPLAQRQSKRFKYIKYWSTIYHLFRAGFTVYTLWSRACICSAGCGINDIHDTHLSIRNQSQSARCYPGRIDKLFFRLPGQLLPYHHLRHYGWDRTQPQAMVCRAGGHDSS